MKDQEPQELPELLYVSSAPNMYGYQRVGEISLDAAAWSGTEPVEIGTYKLVRKANYKRKLTEIEASQK